MTPLLEKDPPARTRWGIDRVLLPAKAFYFSFYIGSASLVPFLALYYRESGLTAAQIGILATISPIVTWLAAPFWGALADSTRQHRAILTTTIVGAMVSVILLSQAQGIWWFIPIVAAYAFFIAPILPLVDNSVMNLLGDRRDLYGRQRVWGAVGWGVSGAVSGILVDSFGLGVIFYAFVAYSILLLLVSTRLKVTSGTIGQPFWQGVRHLARNRALMIFLVTVLFASLGSGIVHNYIFLYLADLGASTRLMGYSQLTATLSELPVFFFSAILLRRVGARGLLLLSLLAYILRLFAYTLLPPVWLVLPINLLHGLTFSALWVAGVSYANAVAPKGMGATAQGLFAGVTMGLGSAVGALIGGTMYDTLGPTVMFRVAGSLVIVGLVFFLVMGKGEGAEVPKPEAEAPG